MISVFIEATGLGAGSLDLQNVGLYVDHNLLIEDSGCRPSELNLRVCALTSCSFVAQFAVSIDRVLRRPRAWIHPTIITAHRFSSSITSPFSPALAARARVRVPK